MFCGSQKLVTMITNAIEQTRDTGAADALLAGGLDFKTGLIEYLENSPVSGDVEYLPAAGYLHFKGCISALIDWCGGEKLSVHAVFGPVGCFCSVQNETHEP